MEGLFVRKFKPMPTQMENIRRIPLNSLILLNDNVSHDIIPSNERIVTIEQIIKLYDSCHKPRYDLNDVVINHIYDLTYRLISNGNRVIIDTKGFHKYQRLHFTSIISSLNVPIFYLNNNDPLIGRGIININVSNTHVQFITPLHKSNDICESNFKGITIVPDLHGEIDILQQVMDWARIRNNYLIFLGDVIDYGSDSINTVDLIFNTINRGFGSFIIGNHELKINKWLEQYLSGKVRMKVSSGNETTISEIKQSSKSQVKKFTTQLRSLISWGEYVIELDNQIILAHGGIPESHWSESASNNSLIYRDYIFGGKYSMVDGKTIQDHSWTDSIPNGKIVIVGHSTLSKENPYRMLKNGSEIIFADTGCGKGGHLTTIDFRYINGQLKYANTNHW